MNKILKTLAMVAVMFVAVTTVAKAQDANAGGGRRGGGRGGKAVLLKDIKVDSATDAKIDAVLQKYQAQQREMMQGGGQPDMTKVNELMTKRNEEIKALLKEEDRKTFEKNAEEAAAARGRGQRPPATV